MYTKFNLILMFVLFSYTRPFVSNVKIRCAARIRHIKFDTFSKQIVYWQAFGYQVCSRGQRTTEFDMFYLRAWL